MEFKVYNSPTTSEPEPVNGPAEMYNLKMLTALITEKQIDYSSIVLEQFGPLSPWVAWQLGIYAEYLLELREFAEAEGVAQLAVRYAIEFGDPVRVASNRITLSNVYVRTNRIVEAEKELLNVLDTTKSGPAKERAVAHMNLGNILALRARALADKPSREDEVRDLYLSALYHFERSLTFQRKNWPQEFYHRQLEVMKPLYAAVSDLAGCMHCVHQLAPHFLEEVFNNTCQEIKDVETALFTATRLRYLGETDLAQRITKLWTAS